MKNDKKQGSKMGYNKKNERRGCYYPKQLSIDLGLAIGERVDLNGVAEGKFYSK